MTHPPAVTAWRSPDETVALAPAEAEGAWTIRVQVAEAWDAVRIRVRPDTPVRVVKAAALERLAAPGEPAAGFVVKLGGAEVRDEALSLQAAGVRDGSTLLVMGRRRRPVR